MTVNPYVVSQMDRKKATKCLFASLSLNAQSDTDASVEAGYIVQSDLWNSKKSQRKESRDKENEKKKEEEEERARELEAEEEEKGKRRGKGSTEEEYDLVDENYPPNHKSSYPAPHLNVVSTLNSKSEDNENQRERNRTEKQLDLSIKKACSSYASKMKKKYSLKVGSNSPKSIIATPFLSTTSASASTLTLRSNERTGKRRKREDKRKKEKSDNKGEKLEEQQKILKNKARGKTAKEWGEEEREEKVYSSFVGLGEKGDINKGRATSGFDFIMETEENVEDDEYIESSMRKDDKGKEKLDDIISKGKKEECAIKRNEKIENNSGKMNRQPLKCDETKYDIERVNFNCTRGTQDARILTEAKIIDQMGGSGNSHNDKNDDNQITCQHNDKSSYDKVEISKSTANTKTMNINQRIIRKQFIIKNSESALLENYQTTNSKEEDGEEDQLDNTSATTTTTTHYSSCSPSSFCCNSEKRRGTKNIFYNSGVEKVKKRNDNDINEILLKAVLDENVPELSKMLEKIIKIDSISSRKEKNANSKSTTKTNSTGFTIGGVIRSSSSLQNDCTYFSEKIATALRWACRCGKLKSLNFFLAYNVNPPLSKNHLTFSCWKEAIEFQQTKVIDELLGNIGKIESIERRRSIRFRREEEEEEDEEEQDEKWQEEEQIKGKEKGKGQQNEREEGMYKDQLDKKGGKSYHHYVKERKKGKTNTPSFKNKNNSRRQQQQHNDNYNRKLLLTETLTPLEIEKLIHFSLEQNYECFRLLSQHLLTISLVDDKYNCFSMYNLFSYSSFSCGSEKQHDVNNKSNNDDDASAYHHDLSQGKTMGLEGKDIYYYAGLKREEREERVKRCDQALHEASLRKLQKLKQEWKEKKNRENGKQTMREIETETVGEKGRERGREMERERDRDRDKLTTTHCMAKCPFLSMAFRPSVQAILILCVALIYYISMCGTYSFPGKYFDYKILDFEIEKEKNVVYKDIDLTTAHYLNEDDNVDDNDCSKYTIAVYTDVDVDKETIVSSEIQINDVVPTDYYNLEKEEGKEEEEEETEKVEGLMSLLGGSSTSNRIRPEEQQEYESIESSGNKNSQMQIEKKRKLTQTQRELQIETETETEAETVANEAFSSFNDNHDVKVHEFVDDLFMIRSKLLERESIVEKRSNKNNNNNNNFQCDDDCIPSQGKYREPGCRQSQKTEAKEEGEKGEKGVGHEVVNIKSEPKYEYEEETIYTSTNSVLEDIQDADFKVNLPSPPMSNTVTTLTQISIENDLILTDLLDDKYIQQLLAQEAAIIKKMSENNNDNIITNK